MSLIQSIISSLEKWFMSLPIKVDQSTPIVAQVAALILAKNHSITFLPSGSLTNVTKGTVIHRINAGEAMTLAKTIVLEAGSLPLAYALACLDIESCFDPDCINGNFAGSNQMKSADGYDMGIAQEKLRYLIGEQGIKTVDEARAFALDPTKAIPYMVDIMEQRLTWADKQIAGFDGDSSILPQFHNRYYLATQAYNSGCDGVLKILSASPPDHAEIVVALERSFAKTLGEPSVFAEIEG